MLSVGKSLDRKLQHEFFKLYFNFDFTFTKSRHYYVYQATRVVHFQRKHFFTNINSDIFLAFSSL